MPKLKGRKIPKIDKTEMIMPWEFMANALPFNWADARYYGVNRELTVDGDRKIPFKDLPQTPKGWERIYNVRA